jgi:hypothetical protein
MAGRESPTLVVLRQILGEQKATNRRLDTTVERLDTTIERLDALERRQGETEIRLATEIVALAKAVGDVKILLSDRLDVKDKVDDHERRLTTLEGRRA